MGVTHDLTEFSKRWYALRPHPTQIAFINSKARFKVVPAGRRSGKTECAKRIVIMKGIKEAIQQKYEDYNYFLACPTREQAKRIFWEDLLKFLPRFAIKKTSYSELLVKTIYGANFYVIGMDKPQRIEGMPWNGGVLDEYADMKAEAWGANIRPALADRMGWVLFTGVPEGRNHYFDLYKEAINDTTGEYEAFTWKSADILPVSEIESAKRKLDPLTFEQEFEASFVNFEGRAYYQYSDDNNLGDLKYDEHENLIFCFDFNISPAIAVVCQEQILPNGKRGTGVIGEVHIPRNGNTEMVCNRLLSDWGNHKGHVFCYGDATGGAGGSAKIMGSDWDIIQRMLRGKFKSVNFCVPKANPREKVRVTAMNCRLKELMYLDRSRTVNLQKDFEGVAYVQGGTGELDKKKTPTLTHLSDALGYYIVYEFPTAGTQTKVFSL